MAVTFADLHDTAERMLQKGVIKEIVPWARSRFTLYWRLRRILAEDRVKKEIRRLKPSCSDTQTGELLKKWFFEERGSLEVNDKFLSLSAMYLIENLCYPPESQMSPSHHYRSIRSEISP